MSDFIPSTGISLLRFDNYTNCPLQPDCTVFTAQQHSFDFRKISFFLRYTIERGRFASLQEDIRSHLIEIMDLTVQCWGVRHNCHVQGVLRGGEGQTGNAHLARDTSQGTRRAMRKEGGTYGRTDRSQDDHLRLILMKYYPL